VLNLSTSPAVQEADVVVLFMDDDQTKDDFSRRDTNCWDSLIQRGRNREEVSIVRSRRSSECHRISTKLSTRDVIFSVKSSD
jgi:hypothetical protein